MQERTRELLEKLKQKLGPYQAKDTKNGIQYSFRCPFCWKRTGKKPETKKFSLRIEESSGQVKWKCWIADCSVRGTGTKKLLGYDHKVRKVIDLQDISKQSIMKMIYGQQEQQKQHIICPLPKDFRSLTSISLSDFGQKRLKYVYDRGISNQKLKMYNVGYSDQLRRIIFPSYDQGYKYRFWTGRQITGSSRWKWIHRAGYNNCDMVFNEFFINWSLPIMLVEGVFDWLNACNAIPLLNGAMTKQTRLYKLIKKYRPKIILRLDNDAKRGRNRIFQLISQTLGLSIYVLRFPNKDLGQQNGKLKFMINKDMKLISSDVNVYVQKIDSPLKLILEEIK